MKNKTLTKNMPYVKRGLIPPVKGPNPQGIVRSKNDRIVKTNNELRRQVV